MRFLLLLVLWAFCWVLLWVMLLGVLLFGSELLFLFFSFFSIFFWVSSSVSFSVSVVG